MPGGLVLLLVPFTPVCIGNWCSFRLDLGLVLTCRLGMGFVFFLLDFGFCVGLCCVLCVGGLLLGVDCFTLIG